MVPFESPKEYLFNLYATNTSQAKRIWRQDIKNHWNHECAYCGSKENLTIDHIIPQSKGGQDTTHNVVCCCESCNHDKGHTPWEMWFSKQIFFTEDRRNSILKWMKNKKPQQQLYVYPRKRML